ncbi:50S ribosomal protein L6 [Patescibacteria group bacterium]|nr:50S ribosomal protein L6 [Patescibacteria group bacterium]
MSRIGKQLVLIPSGVSVEIQDAHFKVKGAKGELEMDVHPSISIEKVQNDSGEDAIALRLKQEGDDRAVWGTMMALVANMVTGVSVGWSKQLELNGVGYKMNLAGKTLKMQLGYSHESIYELPAGIEASVEGNTLNISGPDKELVGKVASEIRALKKPEPYKGKGFKYSDEIIRRKVGKAAKND